MSRNSVSFSFHVTKYISLFCSFPFHPANLQSRVKKGKMTQEKFDKTISLLKGTVDYESLKDVDMVIEVFLNSCLFGLCLRLYVITKASIKSSILFSMFETGCY